MKLKHRKQYIPAGSVTAPAFGGKKCFMVNYKKTYKELLESHLALIKERSELQLLLLDAVAVISALNTPDDGFNKLRANNIREKIKLYFENSGTKLK